jgi:hypothetical protein
MVAELTAAYHKEAGADAREFFKVRVGKSGGREVSAPLWLPADHSTGASYAAFGNALISVADAHADPVEAPPRPGAEVAKEVDEKLAPLPPASTSWRRR